MISIDFRQKKIDDSNNIICENILPLETDLDYFLLKKLNYQIESYVVECIFSRKILDVFNQIPHTPLAWCFDDLLWIQLSSRTTIFTIQSACVYWRCSNLNISGYLDNKDTAIKKLEACCIYIKQVQSLNLLKNREEIFRTWIFLQYLDKIPYLDSIKIVEEYFHKIPLLSIKENKKYAVPATFEQEQCWEYHMQSGQNISPQVLHFQYKLNASSLEAADKIVDNFVYHNDWLRASFIKQADNLMLVINDYDSQRKYYQHRYCENQREYETSSENFILNIEKSLDIRKDSSLQKIFITVIPNSQYYLNVFIHHLLCDEYSLSQMKSQLDTSFKVGVETNENCIASYALWQRRLWRSNKFAIKNHWIEKLSEPMNEPFSYTYHSFGIKKHNREEFLRVLNTHKSELYRTKLTKEGLNALRIIQKKYTSSLLCIFFYAIRFLFSSYFGCNKVLLSSPLRNITNRRFRDTIGYLAGGLYSYDEFIITDNIEQEIKNYFFSILQSMRFLISNHKYFGIDETKLRLSNGVYVNIMPANYRVCIYY